MIVITLGDIVGLIVAGITIVGLVIYSLYNYIKNKKCKENKDGDKCRFGKD